MGRKLWFVAVLLPVGAVSVWAQLKTLKPGFNLFSVQQDIQTGNEAKKQVESQMPVVHDARLTAYLTELGRRLQASPRAGNWPYQFQAINDKNINAFALPGGPILINTATILAADNEAQLAGVMAHEMSHVVLRHGTHEASKQRFIQIPAILASAAAGNSM